MTAPLVFLALACTGTPSPPPAPPADDAPLDVVALSFPAGWLARRIGGARVQVQDFTPVGEDPPFWQPPPDRVAALADADLVVANGAGFERWVATATLPARRLVDSAAGLALIELPGVTHSHGKAGEHSHAGIDPHTWSDPRSYLAQGRTVHGALVAADPAGQATYDAGLAALVSDLEALDATLEATLAPARGRRLAASHPAFNYVARRYGLDLTSFDFDPEAPLEAEARAAFEAWAASAGPTPTLWWEATPTAEVVASLPDTVDHVVLDPLEQPAGLGDYDYLAQARANVAVLDAWLAPPEPTP